MAQDEKDLTTTQKVTNHLENKLGKVFTFDKPTDIANIILMAIGGFTTALVVVFFKLRLWQPKRAIKRVSNRRRNKRKK